MEICGITQVPEKVLESILLLLGYSVAQKMSWAANRETTRIEDKAYCLLGLFGVNMPSLYGERNRAFIQLQGEIMKNSTDETLFAWMVNPPERQPTLFRGFLATSPEYFSKSGSSTRRIHSKRSMPFNVANMGLHLEMMLFKVSDVRETCKFKSENYRIVQVYVAVLNCIERQSQQMIGILLGHFSGGDDTLQEASFVRINGSHLVFINSSTYKPSESDRTTIFARLAETTDPLAADKYAQRVQNARESRYGSVWLQTLPNNSPITGFCPKYLRPKVKHETWIEKLDGQISLPVRPSSAAILF
jgi:hypothetical protein